MKSFRQKWAQYKKATKLEISFDEFMQVGALKRIHEKIGTVLPYEQDLTIYKHMLHFGMMFFYKHLTTKQKFNSPTLDLSWDHGDACCF